MNKSSMKKIIFVWNFPRVAGVPIDEFLQKKRVKGYCDVLNAYFAEHNMEWQAALDSTFGDIEKLLKSDSEMLVFLPGGKTRFWAYDKNLKESKILLYYLTEMEFYEKDISKLIEVIGVDANDIN